MPPWPDQRLQDLFGIEHPIVQAPMAGSSSLDMAVAVTEAGGLGSLACAAQDAETLRETLTVAKSKTEGPLNVNFFAHVSPDPDDDADAAWLDRLTPYYEARDIAPPTALSAGPIQPFGAAMCEVVEAITPAVVSFHFGLPGSDLVHRVKAAGARVISSATTVDEARWLAENGCDAIIAQGYEAGGHRGMFLTSSVDTQIGTLALVPQIADAVDMPVIAAGGIADGRGIAAAFALGASGAQIGTAYLFTAEATVNPLYMAALGSAETLATSITNVFSGRPARALVNQVMLETGPIAETAAFPKGFAAMGPLRADAERAGSRDYSAHYCGQGAALSHETTAAQLTRDLAQDARQRLHWMAGV